MTKESILKIISSSTGYKVTEEEIINKTTLGEGDFIDITNSINYHFNLDLSCDTGWSEWETIGDFVNYVLSN
jgi:hypothetical protein